MIPQQPIQKPRPNFGSGPCPKRPGFDHSVAYRDAAFGRSHRSKLGLGKIQESLKLSREILGLPDDYLIGIVPASDTGAVEMAMWNLLGPLNVSVIFFDSFGKEWWTDASSQLKLPKLVKIDADFGETPDATKVDWEGDVVFTWNGTTAGVKMPNGDWIPDDRKGITICDATSAIFAMDLPWNKLDVVTYSWQKVLGGEAAHGMMILSPRAIARLNSYMPPWPLPKIFRLRKGDKLNQTIFDGSVINTVSMLCVEDYLDALLWTKSLGGLKALLDRSEANLAVFTKFVEEHDWIEFLCKKKEWRSNTSVCFVINDLDATEVKKMTALLAELHVAYDINSYRDAPAGLRIWCGATVDAADCEKLCPWLEWAHTIVKNKISWKQKIIVTDGMAAPAVKELQSLGFDVTLKKFTVEELQEGALADYDAVVIRSATKLMEKEIEAACKKEGNRLRIIARAGVGVDNVHVPTATKHGVIVINAPLAATRSVAELALAHMLCSVRQLTFADRGARTGQWLKATIKGTELHGKRLGFVGFGRIGQEFGRMAQGLGMELHAYDPFLPPEVAEKAGCILHADIHDLFTTCTHITIHCNLTPDTKNLVGRDLVMSMPDVAPDGTKCGRHIVNCARGGVIDEDACADLLREGHLASLALDVFATEPMPKDLKLLECEQFHCTPHVGASTLEAQSRVGAQTVEALIASLQGNVPRANFVNPDVVPRK